MSHKLISHNLDLKKLRDEGYEIEIKNSLLLIYNIPYVNSNKEILYGTLVTPLGDLSGDKTTKPSDHVIYFKGEHPCDNYGVIIKGIKHSSSKKILATDIEVDHSFSNKPPTGYEDYYDKVTTYIKIIESFAQSIDSSVTARNYNVIESDGNEHIFKYIDTNSSRANILAISEKLQNLKIAIVGLGGTGSYILDFIAKTPVNEIHLFDSDSFLSHNAFRSPGSISLDELRQKPKKVNHFFDCYSKMRRNIFPHEYDVDLTTFDELLEFDCIFICIDVDERDIKKSLIKILEENKRLFIDVGVGINEINMSLLGNIRVTTVDENKHDHIENRISFSNKGINDYDQNIQISEINALNASLAVIKWKKIYGFYYDQLNEYNSIYDISTNKIINDEINT